MKKHAVICGAGKMGVAIGYAMKSLGYNISIIENNPININQFFHHNGDCQSFSHWSQIEQAVDVFISALPYYATLDAALWAIDNGVRYCDLGGSVQTSASICEIAQRKAIKPVMTDLGLAPGWINLMAEEVCSLLQQPDSVKMMVGGIPEKVNSSDPLNYLTTWSVDGLLNEYMDECEILKNGDVELVPGMSGLEDIIINGMALEAFCTSGASAHSITVMKNRGVKNVCYKTLRWRGHCNMIKYLIKALGGDRNKIGSVFNYSNEQHDHDMVIMYVIANRGDLSVTKTLNVAYGDNFSAMQRATAFPTASVADIIASGCLDEINYLTYADVPLGKFNDSLSRLLTGRKGEDHVVAG